MRHRKLNSAIGRETDHGPIRRAEDKQPVVSQTDAIVTADVGDQLGVRL